MRHRPPSNVSTQNVEPTHSTARIEFGLATDRFGAFSNFARFPIVLKGLVWPTNEHYFQAQKFAGTEHEEAIRLAPSPVKAAQAGRQRSRPLRPDWAAAKEPVMLEALRAKFTQHQGLRSLLLSTGDAVLVEHTEHDTYWGDGGDGRGKNRLGCLLMQVRGELREELRTSGGG